MTSIQVPDANGNLVEVTNISAVEGIISVGEHSFDTEQAEWLISALQAALDQTLADEAEEDEGYEDRENGEEDDEDPDEDDEDTLTIVPGHHVIDGDDKEGIVTCIYTRDEDGMRMAEVFYSSGRQKHATWPIVSLHHTPRSI